MLLFILGAIVGSALTIALLALMGRRKRSKRGQS